MMYDSLFCRIVGGIGLLLGPRRIGAALGALQELPAFVDRVWPVPGQQPQPNRRSPNPPPADLDGELAFVWWHHGTCRFLVGNNSGWIDGGDGYDEFVPCLLHVHWCHPRAVHMVLWHQAKREALVDINAQWEAYMPRPVE